MLYAVPYFPHPTKAFLRRLGVWSKSKFSWMAQKYSNFVLTITATTNKKYTHPFESQMFTLLHKFSRCVWQSHACKAELTHPFSALLCNSLLLTLIKKTQISNRELQRKAENSCRNRMCEGTLTNMFWRFHNWTVHYLFQNQNLSTYFFQRTSPSLLRYIKMII